MLHFIIGLFLEDNSNVIDISNKLNEKFSLENTDIKLIYEFISQIRHYIAHYYKDLYILEKLANEGENRRFAIDESLFVHMNGSQIWVIGIIDTSSHKIRLEISKDRSSETIKKIITKHIDKGNIIISDSWPSYNWLDDLNNGYVHIKHNHSTGIFGSGLNSSSIIENTWANLKQKIKKIYHKIPNNNFVLFLKEAEWRRNNAGINNKKKFEDLLSIFEYVKNTSGFLYSIEEL